MKIIHHKVKKNESEQKWIEFLKKYNYPEKQLKQVAAKLNNMPEELQNALVEWDYFGKIPDISSEGFAASELIDGFGLTPIAAILVLDWLRNDPEGAKTALAQPISQIIVSEESVEKVLKAEESDQKDDND